MGEMLLPNQPQDRVILEPDTYLLQIENIEKKQGTYKDQDTGEEKDSTYYRWTFMLVDQDPDKVPEDAAGMSLRGNTSTATGPKSKMFGWVSAVLGEPWTYALDFPDDLIGSLVRGVIDIKTYKDEYNNLQKYNVIEKLLPAKRNNADPAKAKRAPNGREAVTADDAKATLINDIGAIVGELGWDKATARANRLEVVPRDVRIAELTIGELRTVHAAFADTLKAYKSSPEEVEDIPF